MLVKHAKAIARQWVSREGSQTPGFFGAYQLSVYAGFAMYFTPEQVVGPGSAYVFIMYLSQLAITLVCGGTAMAIEHTSLSEALEAAPELEQSGR